MRLSRDVSHDVFRSPGGLLTAVAAIAVVLVATLVVLTRLAGTSTPSTGEDSGSAPGADPVIGSSSSSDAPGVPANDQEAVSRLENLAGLLRTDPAAAASAVGQDPDIRSRYLPGRDDRHVAGVFSVRGESGNCYALRFSADSSWVATGDTAGLAVTGPALASSQTCRSS